MDGRSLGSKDADIDVDMGTPASTEVKLECVPAGDPPPKVRAAEQRHQLRQVQRRPRPEILGGHGHHCAVGVLHVPRVADDAGHAQNHGIVERAHA